MKKIISLIILIFLISTGSLKAQSATDSSLTDKIKERLEKTAEEGVDKIKEELVAKTKTPRKKAYVGQIKTINNDSFILEYKSQNYPILIDKKEGWKTDDYLLALGFFYPETNQFTAKKLLRLSPFQPPINRQLITGKIEEIDGNKVTVDSKKLTITAKTNITVNDIIDPVVDDFELKDNLFAIVIFDKSGNINEVKSVLVIPGTNNPVSSAPLNASESAVASPSAKIE